MSQIDDFASALLEESKRFFEKAKAERGSPGETAYHHAALALAFCSLEAHVSSICDDFAVRGDLTPHERAVLLEQDVRLEKGQFELTGALKMYRLVDRIEFLHVRFGGAEVTKNLGWWANLARAINLRNELVHPKAVPTITEGAIESAISAIVEALDALFLALYKKSFPAKGRGLQSKMIF
jgi:hypothetical protein